VPYILPQIDDLQPLLEQFYRAAQETGLKQVDLEPAFAFHVYVGETDARAAEEARPYIQRYVDTRAVGNTKSFAELQEKGLIIIGGPEHCIQMIQRLQGWGMRRMLAIFNYGGFPHAHTLACMHWSQLKL
jgi:alkanesulfonate monooxygenase SsuD/methylene tetrahydromethanopterin reductase-like flavin-dependent oxidoreductase (luciferase family)